MNFTDKLVCILFVLVSLGLVAGVSVICYKKLKACWAEGKAADGKATQMQDTPPKYDDLFGVTIVSNNGCEGNERRSALPVQY